VGHCGKTNDSVDFPLFNIFDENKNKIEVNKSYQIALIFFESAKKQNLST